MISHTHSLGLDRHSHSLARLDTGCHSHLSHGTIRLAHIDVLAGPPGCRYLECDHGLAGGGPCRLVWSAGVVLRWDGRWWAIVPGRLSPACLLGLGVEVVGP